MTLLPVACFGSPDRNAIALTFDDGPSKWTNAILDELHAKGARATFFVVGRWIDEYECSAQLLQRMHDDGHEIGNHTYDHQSLPTLSNDADVRDQLKRTSDRIQGLRLSSPRLMRPPALEYDERIQRIAADPMLGFAWLVDRTPTCDPHDWCRDDVSVADIVATASKAQAGAIVLFHDGPPPERPDEDCQSTVDALPKVLDLLAATRLRFVTVSELLAIDNFARDASSAQPM